MPPRFPSYHQPVVSTDLFVEHGVLGLPHWPKSICLSKQSIKGPYALPERSLNSGHVSKQASLVPDQHRQLQQSCLPELTGSRVVR